MVLWRRGLAAQAAEEFSRAAAYQPNNPVAHIYLAEALNQVGRLEEAVFALEHALQLDPRQPRALYLLGRVLDRMHRPEEALKMYRRAREVARE